MREQHTIETCEGDCTISLIVYSEPTDINNPYEVISLKDKNTGATININRYELESACANLARIKLRSECTGQPVRSV